MLIRRFRIKDIREFEDDNNANILKYFDTLKIEQIISLVSLGNGRCSEEEASEILDKYLENHTFMDAVLEIKEALIGKGDNETDTEESDDIDITEYGSLTELYGLYCMQLMSIGFGYSEFWDLSTKDMYRVFNSINIKRQNEINQSLQLAHTQAALIGQAVWGKLQRKVPQVDLEKPKYDDSKMDYDQAVMIANLKAFANKQNKRVNKNG